MGSLSLVYSYVLKSSSLPHHNDSSAFQSMSMIEKLTNSHSASTTCFFPPYLHRTTLKLSPHTSLPCQPITLGVSKGLYTNKIITLGRRQSDILSKIMKKKKKYVLYLDHSDSCPTNFAEQIILTQLNDGWIGPNGGGPSGRTKNLEELERPYFTTPKAG